ncbi:MAG: L-lactate dehydrogenase, partial [Erysipelotrichaceae bacterium]|nr:L-lactate dehydrogenase [Erysipelotrichaceae bacterium]
MIERRKLVLVVAGFVGMSMAYALVCQGNNSGINELVLVDIDMGKIIGEAMDLSHGLPYSRSHMKVKAGDYEDCSDADLVVITAGLNQKPGQTRLDLA